MEKQENKNVEDNQCTIYQDGLRLGIYGSIKDREIAHVECERWMGGPRGPEKITFKDGSAVMFKCDIRHYWMPENPDTAIREAIVYQIDKIVGLGLVPKTMVIDDTINGKRYDGSVQEWIKGAKDGYQVEEFTSEGQRDYQRLMVFDFIIGNSDRHLANTLYTDDGKLHAIDNNACLIISADEDILSFPNTVIHFFSKRVVHDLKHIVDLIETFYNKKEEILSLIEKYVHDNTELAKLMVESRINYLYHMLKKKKPFPRKYLEWRRGLDNEIRAIKSRSHNNQK